MHKMGPRGPKHYIFGNQFNSKNARVLRFHVFLHFHATKHIISSCYSKWTNSLEVVNFIPIQFWSPGTHIQNKIRNLLSIRSTSGKFMISYDRMKMAFTSWHFLSKNGCQKYSIWVQWDLIPSCFCSVISLSEETNKFSELDYHTLVFFLLHSMLV